MSLAQHILNTIPVTVASDWSTADNAATDVANMIEKVGGSTSVFPAIHDLVVTIWEGKGDPDDSARLTIAATTGAGTWTVAFNSIPAEGAEVYITDIY